MRGIVKKYVHCGFVLILFPVLFYSCAGSKKAAYVASDKYARQIDEDKFKSLYYEALEQKELGNYDKAMELFRKCLVIDPASPAVNFEISKIWDYNKRSDSSLIYIRKAVKGDPSNIWYGNYYAQNLVEMGKSKDAIKEYQDLIKTNPAITDLYYKLALSQLQAEEYKEAIETYNTLEQKQGGVDEDITMSKVEILEKIKEYAQAEEEIQKLVKKDPSTPQYYDMLGNLYQLEGKDDKAFEEYQETEKLYPHDPMVHLSLADYYKSKNQDTKAYDELQKAFEEPALDMDTKIRIIMGLSTFTTADSIFDEAKTLSMEMVKANPTDPRAHVVYAELLLYHQDIKEARDQYRIAVSEDSSKYNNWNKLLQLEAQLKDNKDMESESREAIGLFPDNGQLYYYNGFANMQLKNFDDARNAFRSGIMYASDDSALLGFLYTSLGDVSYYTRRFAASDSAYEEALKINPNNDNVLNNYSYYLSVRDTNLARAEEMSKKANELVAGNDEYEDTYAWILYMQGNYQAAKEWEDKAMANGGDNDPTIAEHYGDILFKLGQKDDAVKYWIKAKEEGTNSELLEREIRDKQLYEK